MPLDTLLSVISTMTTSLAVAGGVFFMMRYLNRGESPFASREVERIKKDLTAVAHEIVALNATRSASGTSLSPEERLALLNEVSESLKSQAAQDVLSRIREQINAEEAEGAALKVVRAQSEQTIDRLRQELFSLTKRANLNLSIGIVTTLTGLLLLGMFVLQDPLAPTDATAFVIGFVPRISLVVLIEVFAYFFLRLYKSTLAEIKYFQNEVTSMEAKFLALTVATRSGSPEHLAKVIDHLSQAERNFILTKDQTTVDLERARFDHQERTDVWSKLAELIGKKKEA